ncbi:hypothetical protein KQ306_01375 [Synechococcus sp. CS-1324]|uniref:hypothetical protein n=1 Tax=Synechococcus sp. CS-1324 TaxID=2847980 RepID=UPI000DB735AE|nr:hypothetical protein [Synechococcus sp. CS-1324]MCT0229514.1 hypothetical protein [Synechococcus sp. CS-1324]PZV04892.1 MAG: hypothetical protein DCF23_05130 [Cyanobium sp.]
MNTSFPTLLRAVGFASLIQLVWLPALLISAIDQRHQARRLAESAPGSKSTAPAWKNRWKDPIDQLFSNQDLPGLQPQRSTPQPATAFSLANGVVVLNGGKRHSRADQPEQTGVAIELGRDALGILRPLPPAGFTAAELLGGPLTLASLQEAPMPSLARSERVRWLSSGDPLAPLNAEWREPMRQAMRQLESPDQPPATQPLIQQARMVHVPSRRLRSSEQVPVAIHADGTVQVLRRPAAPEALRDIEEWSQRQSLPDAGKVVAAVVSLEPLPSAPDPANSQAAALPVPVAAPVATPVAAPEPAPPTPSLAN